MDQFISQVHATLVALGDVVAAVGLDPLNSLWAFSGLMFYEIIRSYKCGSFFRGIGVWFFLFFAFNWVVASVVSTASVQSATVGWAPFVSGWIGFTVSASTGIMLLPRRQRSPSTTSDSSSSGTEVDNVDGGVNVRHPAFRTAVRNYYNWI